MERAHSSTRSGVRPARTSLSSSRPRRTSRYTRGAIDTAASQTTSPSPAYTTPTAAERGTVRPPTRRRDSPAMTGSMK